jgi:hypothetical protein
MKCWSDESLGSERSPFILQVFRPIIKPTMTIYRRKKLQIVAHNCSMRYRATVAMMATDNAIHTELTCQQRDATGI